MLQPHSDPAVVSSRAPSSLLWNISLQLWLVFSRLQDEVGCVTQVRSDAGPTERVYPTWQSRSPSGNLHNNRNPGFVHRHAHLQRNIIVIGPSANIFPLDLFPLVPVRWYTKDPPLHTKAKQLSRSHNGLCVSKYVDDDDDTCDVSLFISDGSEDQLIVVCVRLKFNTLCSVPPRGHILSML